jgi:uncharacterized membrane protein
MCDYAQFLTHQTLPFHHHSLFLILMHKRFILPIFLLLALLVGVFSVSTAQASLPIIRAVLFFSPTCPHCVKVIQQDLPPIQEKYKDQLLIAKIDVTTPAGEQLYQDATLVYNVPDGRLGVPALVVGEYFLVGDQEIPAQFPKIIETTLPTGIEWPALPGLKPFVAALEDPQPQEPDNSPLAKMLQRFQRDIPGNTLAVIVLLGMLFSLVYVGYTFVMGDPAKAKPWPAWVIPLLAILGVGVAVYLTFIETTKAAPFCGPIGDCASVQKSPYAILFGFLPVGVLGLIGYLGIIALWIFQAFAAEKWRHIAWLVIWVMTIFGVLFSIYLTFLEPFVIGAACIWCISSAILITLLFWAATPLAKLATSSVEDG